MAPDSQTETVEPHLDDYMSAYVALEEHWHDERLTEAQRETLREAHVVLQNCEAMDGRELAPGDEPDIEPNYGTLGGT